MSGSFVRRLFGCSSVLFSFMSICGFVGFVGFVVWAAVVSSSNQKVAGLIPQLLGCM